MLVESHVPAERYYNQVIQGDKLMSPPSKKSHHNWLLKKVRGAAVGDHPVLQKKGALRGKC